jgi:HD-GYP domain-containing protein (c-di-GMP phosphodiesterase class II)
MRPNLRVDAERFIRKSLAASSEGSNHMQSMGISNSAVHIKLSEVISALSYALDITEGQPKGHAARSCMLGMRLAKELKLGAVESSALFYALLLKDLGCSSNAGRMCYLFGSDDRAIKRDFKTSDTSTLAGTIDYVARSVAEHGSLIDKAKHFARVAMAGSKEANALIDLRCERGAKIARELEFPELTAKAILSLDEHWDGHGHPDGLKGEQIPLLARILNISQTIEVFLREYGLPAACEMVAQRSGTWFDPELATLFLKVKDDSAFWNSFNNSSPSDAAAAFEPQDATLTADAALLDRIAEGFSQVIDAKSPWTYRHSEGVARIAAGIAEVMDFSSDEVRYIRRAALVHDVGKLGISNLILDKPGKLTPEEITEMRKHPAYTHQILSQVEGFKDLAELAAAHHEQLDGHGYHRGLDASQLSTPARILAVADIYEALTAKRPYRQDLTTEEVSTIMRKKLGWGICPVVHEALGVYVIRSGYAPMKLAA